MRTLLGTCIVSLALATPAHGQDAKELLGRWEPAMVSRNSFSAMLEFRADKRMLILPGALVRGTYSVDSVKITHSAPTGQQELIRGYEVKGDSLTVWSSRHPTFTMVRTPTSTSRSGLVGEWSYVAGDRVTIETFRADSTWRAWTQFGADTAEYLVRRNFVTIRMGRMETRMMWRLTDVGMELQRDVNTRGSLPTQSYVRERQ
jgi:hypothetical protein